MTRQTAIQTTTANNIPAPAAAASQRTENSWSYIPQIDLVEQAGDYTIFCDAPGLSANEFDLSYENGVLHVHGPVAQRYGDSTRFLRQEYGVGDFDREIPLGRLAEFVDVDRISASYEHGVLTIQLPKLAAAQPKRIEVKTA